MGQGASSTSSDVKVTPNHSGICKCPKTVAHILVEQAYDQGLHDPRDILRAIETTYPAMVAWYRHIYFRTAISHCGDKGEPPLDQVALNETLALILITHGES